MEVKDDKIEDIEDLVEIISDKLQQLEKLLKEVDIEKTNIILPSGIVSLASSHRRDFSFVVEEPLRSNLSYHLMLDEILYWMLMRFGFYASVQEMLIKITIANVGNIIGAIVSYLVNEEKTSKNSILRFLKKINRRKKTKEGKVRKSLGIRRKMTILVRRKILKKELKKELLWIWGVRCKQHFETVRTREYGKYLMRDYDKAQSIFLEFYNQLTKASEEKKL